jgi:hypothetical protein
MLPGPERPNASKLHSERLDEQAKTLGYIMRARYGDRRLPLSFADVVDLLVDGYGVDRLSDVTSKTTAGKIIRRAEKLGYMKVEIGSNKVGDVSDSVFETMPMPLRTADLYTPNDSVNDARRLVAKVINTSADKAVEHMAVGLGSSSKSAFCSCWVCRMEFLGTDRGRTVHECTARLNALVKKDKMAYSLYIDTLKARRGIKITRVAAPQRERVERCDNCGGRLPNCLCQPFVSESDNAVLEVVLASSPNIQTWGA